MKGDNIFNSAEYYNYMIQYEGTYDESTSTPKDIYITILNEDYAILSMKEGSVKEITDTMAISITLNAQFKTDFKIIYIQPPEMYTLQQVSAIEAADVKILQTDLPLSLTGKGVLVAIVDTGIDYLNEEFMNIDGTTRINMIWDQTISSNDDNVKFGSIYTKDDINRAIDAYKNGGDPYGIVPSKDTEGHGTNMAGIVGARGKNPYIQGVAPKCEFIIVKLLESIKFKTMGNYAENIKVYNSTVIFAALEFLKRILLKENNPMVILFPLGSNSGDHEGNHILDSYIESISSSVGVVLVTGAGNEGAADNHVSGTILNKNSKEYIEILVGEKQKDLYMEIWIDLPNIVNIELISPSGESTNTIPVFLASNKSYLFVFEGTEVKIYYYIPERQSGKELIRINFFNIRTGIWRVKLTIEQGNRVTYNAWINQKVLLANGTRLRPSDQYGTFTIPGDSDFVVTVAAYNQNNNNLLSYSGNSFKNYYSDRIDFAAGGVNTPTVGLNNTIDIINGTSLSAAVGAGACVLLFQWGIVDKNYPYMYIQSIKTFLRRGAVSRKGDDAPNPQLGYGMLNVYNVFYNMI